MTKLVNFAIFWKLGLAVKKCYQKVNFNRTIKNSCDTFWEIFNQCAVLLFFSRYFSSVIQEGFYDKSNRMQRRQLASWKRTGRSVLSNISQLTPPSWKNVGKWESNCWNGRASTIKYRSSGACGIWVWSVLLQ